VIKRPLFIFISQVTGLIFFLTFFVGTVSFAQLQFVQNKGQWDKHIQYKSDMPDGAFFIEKNGYTVLMNNDSDLAKIEEHMHGDNLDSSSIIDVKGITARASLSSPPIQSAALILHSHAYKVNFVGASDNAVFVSEKPLSTYNNYFIGNDSSKWQSSCGIYQSITCINIYPNIDLHYYTNAGKLKYDFIVHPGGRIEDIKIKYEGADKLEIKDKELVIGTSVGNSKELSPYSYQLQTDGRHALGCKYVLKNNIVTFKIDDHDPGATVVIDPSLVFSTFTGSVSDNWGYTATPGPDGSFFAGGIVFGNNYPVSPGAFQTTFNGGSFEDPNGPYDIAIFKFSADGSQRVYATYLGGSEGNEQPQSMICDAQGELIVAGRSSSGDYPVKPLSIPNTGTKLHYDIVVTKFTADGTGLIGSVKMGGSADDGVNIRSKDIAPVGDDATRRNYGDDARSEVILDNNNNVYVASCTQSTDFPVLNSSIQTTFGGGRQDGVVIKFAPDLSSVLFSSFFGGSGDDACFVLSQDPITGNLYIGGGTTSPLLPGDTTNVIHGKYQSGQSDGFVTEIAPDGSAIYKTTYIGTNGNDLVYGLKFDRDGFPYITGTTTGSWPVLPSTVYNNPHGKQFVCKLMPDLSGYIYSTTIGPPTALPNISTVAFLVDRCENVYLSGWGGGDLSRGYSNAGTNGMPVTSNAIQLTTDGQDFYFCVLEKGADTILFGSFFGQRGGAPDHVDGGTSRFDPNGVVYQAICGNCKYDGSVAFPTTAGSWSVVNRGFDCNEAAVKIVMNFAGVGSLIKTAIDGVPYDTTGCLPLTVNFYDTLAPAKKYFWNFGDGTTADTTITGSVAHTFTQVGVFRISLIAEDSNKCNIRDTSYKDIKVSTDKAVLAFDYTKVGPCDSLNYEFDNHSVATIGSFSNKGFVWHYGDGSPNDTLGMAPHVHTFPAPGSYDVMLCAVDTFICNAPACVDSLVHIAVNVKANFSAPSEVCLFTPVTFSNTSSGGTDFIWDFGDGSPVSNAFSPTHIYGNIGTYTVKLIVIDSNTCNKTDTITNTITVSQGATVGFNYTPVIPQVNTPVQFINITTGAVNYIWTFGDGSTSTDINPLHQYNFSDTFNACLIAINASGCRDTTCKPVAALVNCLLDIPTAFTPGTVGTNSIIKVVGFGISEMDWNIYNRQGELVFHSTDPSNGWDGTYKGSLQPTDVYTYTLEAGFSNGTKLKRTGDITLLR
jgi:gliding motility-associated-like protein